MKAEIDLIKAIVSKQANDIDNLKRDLNDQQAKKKKKKVKCAVPSSSREQKLSLCG